MLFARFGEDDPPVGFLDGVFSRIAREKRGRARRGFAIGIACSLASAAGIVPAFRYLASEAARTGFSEYLSLFVSNSGAVVQYWQTFAAVLAETLPALAVAATLALLGVFLAGVREVALTARSAMKQT